MVKNRFYSYIKKYLLNKKLADGKCEAPNKFDDILKDEYDD